DADRYEVTMTAPSAEMTAPPTAWSIRAMISTSKVGARPHRAEPAVKSAKPPMKIFRYPFISPSLDAASRRLTRMIRYALSTHETVTVETSRDFAISGRAIFTIVASRPAMNDPSAITITIRRSFLAILWEAVGSFIVSLPEWDIAFFPIRMLPKSAPAATNSCRGDIASRDL